MDEPSAHPDAARAEHPPVPTWHAVPPRPPLPQQWPPPANGVWPPPNQGAWPPPAQSAPPAPAAAPPWGPSPAAAPYASATFAAPYTAAPMGRFVEAPRRRSNATGLVALTAALVAVAMSIGAAIAGFQIGLGAGDRLPALNGASPLSALTPVRDWVLLGEVCFWVGTVAGIWGLVQGIVAAARARGRTAGIFAIVLAAVGPVLFFVVLTIALGAGAGSAPGGG